MFGSTITLPAEYNLARADQERAKAAQCASPTARRGHLALARIFEQRASLYIAMNPGDMTDALIL